MTLNRHTWRMMLVFATSAGWEVTTLSREAVEVRAKFKQYFTTAGTVEWQHAVFHKGEQPSRQRPQ